MLEGALPSPDFHHAAYGLRIAADWPIPGARRVASDGPVDIALRAGFGPRAERPTGTRPDRPSYVSPYRDHRGRPLLRMWRAGQDVVLRYADGTRFLVTDRGAGIWAAWPPPLVVADMATYLLGPVLGFVLRLRGITCLHASAVAVDGGAIALVGPAGAGKSTVAAAFARLGCAVLSEDVAALASDAGGWLVQPGYPLLRLWPGSVAALYGSPDALPRLTPNWDKRGLDLSAAGYRFQADPLPLSAIYLLDRRVATPAAPFISDVGGREAVMGLVANTYGTLLLDSTPRARDLQLLGRIAAALPVRRLTPHADVARLPALCELVLDDFHRLRTGARTATRGERAARV